MIRVAALAVFWLLIGLGWGACAAQIIHLMQGGT